MSLSTRLRCLRAAWGCIMGSWAAGEATIPASSADSQGASTDAHLGSLTVGVLSPHPLGVCPLWSELEVPEPEVPELEVEPAAAWGLNPCALPKYTRAADSTP